MKQKKPLAKTLLVVSLILVFVGFIGAYLVQTAGLCLEYTELYYETASGLTQNAMLIRPKTARVETPAPCIVVEHGWYNNKEMQDMNYVEYARRGYVVVAVNQYSHGDSDNIGIGYEYDGGNGMYDAVCMAASIPYVDSSRIGVSGHSFGSEACLYAVYKDEETNYISAILHVCSDPQYTVNAPYIPWPRVIYDTPNDPDGYCNVYGSRDVGLVACQYDEFYHGVPTGTEDDIGPGIGYTAPRDFINTVAAQSFLYFGTDPEGQPLREPWTFYKQDIDGEEAIRAIYNPAITHPEATMNTSVAKFSIEYFQEAIPAPNPIPSSNQIWQWKEVFNSLSLHALILFAACFAICMLEQPFFASLKSKEEVSPLQFTNKPSKIWFWTGMTRSKRCTRIYTTLYMTAMHRSSNSSLSLSSVSGRYAAPWCCLSCCCSPTI